MTTPTSNPVPSNNPNDLLFNAEQFDVALNSTAASYTDRLGVVRRTVKGQFDAVDAELAEKLDDAQSQINVKVDEAAASAADAADSALEALGYLQTYRTTSYGALASDPATDPLGNPPTVGDEYFNTTSNLLKRFNGTTWQASDINTANLAESSGSSLVGYQPEGTGAVTTTVESKLLNFPSVWDFMSYAQRADSLLDTPLLDHASAFQKAVDDAIARGLNGIYVTFARRQRYRFGATVGIPSGDFFFAGDHKPVRGASLSEAQNKSGYIFGAAGVDALFDFGVSQNHAYVGAFVCDGMAFYGRVNVETNDYTSQRRAIKFTQTYNGPTRHVLFRNTTATHFEDAYYFDNPAAGTLAAATVTFDSCYTRGNKNSAVFANKRLLGLRYVGNLSESGGQLKGQLHGGVTITDNMLEGSVNTIDISGTGPANLVLERNYFEANSGNFVCRFKPTNIGSSLTLGDNFFGGGAGLSNYDDFVYVGGGTTLVENNTAGTVDYALCTIENAWFGSKLKGKFFMPVDSGISTTIRCSATEHAGKKPSDATLVRVIGFDEIDTPFGKTKNGLIHTGATLGGAGPSQPATYSAGDVIVAVALVKADEGSLPRMIVYDQSSVNLPADTGNMTTGGVAVPANMGGEWQLWCYAFPAARAGTGVRFRFGAGVADKSISIAAYGYQVIPAANFITTTYSAKIRAKVQLWTPYYFEPSQLDGRKTHDWPDLATGTTQSTTVTVTGAELGDFADPSMSVSLGGTRLWAEVTAADTVTVYHRNDTGANVNVASGTLRVRVTKSS